MFPSRRRLGCLRIEIELVYVTQLEDKTKGFKWIWVPLLASRKNGGYEHKGFFHSPDEEGEGGDGGDELELESELICCRATSKGCSTRDLFACNRWTCPRTSPEALEIAVASRASPFHSKAAAREMCGWRLLRNGVRMFCGASDVVNTCSV
jgi:hypothetical protein